MFEFMPTHLAFLDFASWSMLGWLGAGMLPWLIHRWFRQHHDKTTWAAMQLLLAALEQRAQRIRIQQLLLLALRTAIILLVACAAAQPTWRRWALGAPGRSQVHRIVVIDQSYSMGCQDKGVTRFQRALDQAQKLVEDAETLSIVGWGTQVENLTGRPVRDKSVATSVLESMQITANRVSLEAALDGVANALERAKQELPRINDHQVFFLTDMASNTWELDDRTRNKMRELSEQAELMVFDVGVGERENLAITGVSVDPPLVLQDREHTLNVSLRNYGLTERTGIEVELYLDGRKVEAHAVDVDAGASAVVSTPYRFLDVGWHTVEARLVGGLDSLPIDDRRWCVFQVRSQIRVACFSSHPGELHEVARALSFTQGAIIPEELPLTRLASQDLSEYDAVYLAGELQFAEREVELLQRYVEQGGALTVFLSAPEFHLPFLPVEQANAVVEGGFYLDPLEYAHPVVRPFLGREKAGLLGVIVSKYVKLQSVAEARIVLALDSGDPALVVGRHGRGTVSVLAFPVTLSSTTQLPWSSFPVSPSFVPVMRELLNDSLMQNWSHSYQLIPGQVVQYLPKSADVAQQCQIQLPSGELRELSETRAQAQERVYFSETTQVGVYSLRSGTEEVARYALNVESEFTPSESDLAALGVDTLPDEIVGSITDSQSLLDSVEIPLSRSMLQLATLLLFCELTLAWYLGGGWG